MFDPTDPASIERHARKLLHRRLGELVDVPAGELQGRRTRGNVGSYLERFFGVAPNSQRGPDLPGAGVEIKAVPLTRTTAGSLVPKERTFITAIDYATIADQDFAGSPLDLKTRHTLYLFYEHRPDTPVADFRVAGVLLHERDEIDEMMLLEAHTHVRDRVAAGRAHELSEGDTWGVGAATKDSRARDTAQPHSPEPARRRAFAWKPQVTARLWQAAKPRGADGLRRVTAPQEMSAFQADVLTRLQPWFGAAVGELRDRFLPGASDRYKALTAAVSRKLLDTAEQDGLEPFRRLGVTVRTMRVDPVTCRPREAVSFPAFEPVELATEEWERSDLLARVRSLFFITFRDDPSGAIAHATLAGAFFWAPTAGDLAVMRREWRSFRDAFAASDVDGLPTSRHTEILHVRPHGRDRHDRVTLPDGRSFPRSSFWLNRGYLQGLVAGSDIGARTPRARH